VRRDTSDMLADGGPREQTLTLDLVKRARPGRRRRRIRAPPGPAVGPRAGDARPALCRGRGRRLGPMDVGAPLRRRDEDLPGRRLQARQKWQNQLTLREIERRVRLGSVDRRRLGELQPDAAADPVGAGGGRLGADRRCDRRNAGAQARRRGDHVGVAASCSRTASMTSATGSTTIGSPTATIRRPRSCSAARARSRTPRRVERPRRHAI
jgi:hypothetical protein